MSISLREKIDADFENTRRPGREKWIKAVFDQVIELLAEDLPLLKKMQKAKEAFEAEYVKAVVVNADDWCGLYIDGKIFAQGHNDIDVHSALEGTGLRAESIESFYCDQDWIEDLGQLPAKLKDVKREQAL